MAGRAARTWPSTRDCSTPPVTSCPQRHLTRGTQLLDRIASGAELHRNNFFVLQLGQFAKNIFVIDFTRAGLMPSGNIGNVDQADVLKVLFELFNQVSLSNLLMEEIVQKLHLRMIDRFHYLGSLGAAATLAPDRLTARPPDRPGPCFSRPAGGEVLVGGRKVIGSAQVRQGRAFLQHGSILLAGSQEMIEAVSRQPSAIRHQTSDVRTATTLSAALGRSVTFEEVANAIMSTWGDGFSSTAPYRPLPSLTALFSDPAWTWRR